MRYRYVYFMGRGAMVYHRKKNKGRKVYVRLKQGPALVTDLANFLNLDIAQCEIKKHWHYFQSWPTSGIPLGESDANLKRYAELKLLTTLLEEKDVRDRPDLIEHLKSLQDRLKTDLNPLIRSSPKTNEKKGINQGIRGGMQNIIARLNQCTFRPQWALYSEGELVNNEGEYKGWWCTYDPGKNERSTKIDPVILAHDKRLHLGDFRFVVKEVAPRAEVIEDRLYWIVGRILIDADIDRLKTCVECGKYFAAYDLRQVTCDNEECNRQHERKGAAVRVAHWRKTPRR